MNKPIRTTTLTGTALVLAASLALTACGQSKAPSGGVKPEQATASQAAAVKNPLVATFDGGLYVLDGESLQPARTVELPGFNRVNAAGDNRHVIVSTDAGFRVFDATRGAFTGAEYPGAKPGHVVRHAGRTVLFTDGTGQVNVFDPTGLAGGKKPRSRTYTSAAPHHGVAIELAGGQLVSTLGTEEKRTGALVLDKDNKEIKRAENCPGVHGEAAAKDEVVAFGCEDGVLLYKNGDFVKVDSPDTHGAVGTQVGSDLSPVLLGDYKTDPKAELERTTRVSLIDTAKATMKVIDLGTSYSFRSLARGPHGEALVLGTDGVLHVIDPETGTVEKKIEAVGDWQEPLDWQQARPTLFVRDHTAYVSEPAKRQLHAYDLESGKKLRSVTLPKGTNELSGVTAGH
ncbi:zinc metallochaperone AztD [Streptomyces bikiniensis]|uniref:zinc metallochaperone AztD n=1 Tax=Streptomyces bikiniensis TaxID=1896 RepID=UPI0004C154AE|nr:zinc metallochaperone AztD [Streptomyces bikiniensis]